MTTVTTLRTQPAHIERTPWAPDPWGALAYFTAGLAIGVAVVILGALL